MISYFLVGGAASITFVTILTRYREQGREAEGERSLSVILSTMYLVLGSAIVLAEIVAPWYVRWWFNGFDADKAALCVLLTRILLPAQLCFFAGGVFGAVLLVRKQFSVQAVAPLIYGMGTIVGGLLLVKRIGVSSLAIGTVAGAVLRPVSSELVFRPSRGRALPLYSRLARRRPARVGAPLAAAHGRRLARHRRQLDYRPLRLTHRRRSYAVQLRQAVLYRAYGHAGAGRWRCLHALLRQPLDARPALRFRHQRRRLGFSRGFARPSRRVRHGSAWLAGYRPDFYRRPLLRRRSRLCAVYFAIFSVSLFLWSAQAIYARAFYAAGNTFVPMVASTIVTVVSLPVYDSLFHWRGAIGLALASDVGIALQTLTIALLLHKRRMVSLASLDYAEMGRCLLAAVTGGAAAWLVSWALRSAIFAICRAWPCFIAHASPTQSILVAGIAVWIVIAMWVLEKSGSALPRVAMRRLVWARASHLVARRESARELTRRPTENTSASFKRKALARCDQR